MWDNELDMTHMRRALELARQAGCAGEVPVGCVIVLDGEVIGEGYNRREAVQDATSHAEINAIRSACERIGSWRLEGADLYVTLEPCLMCAGAILQARIRRLVFGAFDPKSGMAGSVANVFELPANHHTDVVGGLLESASAALLKDFFRQRRLDQKREKERIEALCEERTAFAETE